MTESAIPETRSRIRRPSPARPMAGIALMLAASLTLPLVDGFAKLLTADHSPFMVVWWRYAVAAGVAAAIPGGWRRDLRAAAADLVPNALRTVLAVAATALFFMAIAEIPMATALGGYFIGPVVAAVLGMRLLGERTTPLRMAAVALGLAGALLIVQPGVSFHLGALLAILSGLVFGGYLVATRAAVSATPPVAALRFQCLVGAMLLAPFAALQWSWPTPGEIALILAMGALSTLCHLLIIAAFRFAETAALSPLVYAELVTATLFGLLVFGEFPDPPAVAGIALVVLGGLAVLGAERRKP